MAANRLKEKGESIGKCIDIIGGLNSALDMRQGGELAQQMNQLYDFCSMRLFEASVHNDAEKLAEVRTVMGNIQQAGKTSERPMKVNTTQVRQLTLQLNQSYRRKEWQTVRKIDKEIYTMLAALKQQPDVAESLRREILQLKQVHLAAMTACEMEKAHLGQMLAKFQNQREGVSEYQQVEMAGGYLR